MTSRMFELSPAAVAAALEASGTGLWRWQAVARKMEWSECLEQLHGIQPGTFPGTIEEHLRLVHADDRDRVSSALQRAASDGALPPLEYRIVRPDGEVRWLEARARAFTDDAGARSLAGTSTDITDRRRREDELRRAEEEAADHGRRGALTADVGFALTQSTSLGEMLQRCAQSMVDRLGAAFARIWTLDESGQVLVLQTSAGMYTHTNGPHGRVPVGKFKIGLIAEEREPHLTNQVVGDPRVGDQEWAQREGMVAFAGYPLIVGDELLGVLAMFARHSLSDADFRALETIANGVALGIARARGEEARERRTAELRERAEDLLRLTSALERSNRDLDQFAYAASHDLKAPLRGISNLALWIEEELGESATDTVRGHIAKLRGRVHRMEALIEGILAYSRAGRTGNPPEPVAVGRLVRDVVDLLAPPPTLRIDVAPDLPVLHTERAMLQQVFMNLIGNAVKYAGGASGCVTVAWAREGDWVSFTVADDGPGIAPAYQEKVWGIFQTLSPRDKVEGTGIGLALVKKVVESRGGRVWLDSAEGKGATFGFTWPAGLAKE